VKKVLIGGLLCTLFLTGCGEKTLMCNMSYDDAVQTQEGEIVEFQSNDEFILKFDSTGENLKKMTIKSHNILDDVQYIDEVEASLQEKLNTLSKEGFKTTIKKDGNKLYSEYIGEMDKISSDRKEQILINNKTYEEVKNFFEDSGYTCK